MWREMLAATAALVLVCSVSCGPEPNDEGLYGSVEKVLVYKVDVDEDGEEVGEKELDIESSYDKRGRLTQMKYFFMEDMANTIKCRYNENGDLIRYTSSDMEGEVDFRAKYSYNIHGVVDGFGWTEYSTGDKVIFEYEHSPDGTRVFAAKGVRESDGEVVVESKYDEMNRIVWMLNHKTEHRPQIETSTTYASRYFRLQIVRVYKTESGEIESRIEEKYDGKGNLISVKSYDSDGKLVSRSELEYGDYDEYGNWTECRQLDWTSEDESEEPRLHSITTREIEYRQ